MTYTMIKTVEKGHFDVRHLTSCITLNAFEFTALGLLMLQETF